MIQGPGMSQPCWEFPHLRFSVPNFQNLLPQFIHDLNGRQESLAISSPAMIIVILILRVAWLT
jgi:hypothetical protein